MSAPYYSDDAVTLHHGHSLDVLRTLEDGSVDCCVTSPPYFGLRDYGVDGQIGAESSPAQYVDALVSVLAEVRRVLADDGVLWLNLGDTYSSGSGGQSALSELGARLGTGGGQKADASKVRRAADTSLPAKNLLGIPWRVAFALQDDGWTLRNEIIWAKPNAMPESVRDRLSTKHEHLFLLSKCPSYWFDLDPIREPLLWPDTTGHAFDGNSPEISSTRGGKYQPHDDKGNRPADGSQHTGGHLKGRNPGDVWTIPTSPFPGAHFATFPVALPERCILAGCKPGGTVLDPFSGSGTTGLAAARHGRRYVGIDLNREYLDLSLSTRLAQTALLDGEAS